MCECLPAVASAKAGENADNCPELILLHNFRLGPAEFYAISAIKIFCKKLTAEIRNEKVLDQEPFLISYSSFLISYLLSIQPEFNRLFLV